MLPFANLSDDPENEYFSDGLAKEIRNRLARVPGLKVAARSSSVAFKDRGGDAREIGRRLEDIFGLQQQVAAAVTEIVAPISAGGPVASPGADPHSFEAYNLYFRGRHYFHKRTEPSLQLNPAYTMALVWHGLVLVKQGRFREAAQRNLEALQLDPLSPIINVTVGFDSLRWGETDRAKASFRAAVEIDPDFPVPHYGLARAHALRREFDEALGEIGVAISCAPGRAFYHAQRSLILLQTGDTAAEARSLGWNHGWWERLDWNLRPLNGR